MARDVVDAHLARALHLSRLDRSGFEAVAGGSHELWQTSTIQALLDGRYDGELTVGELLAHGDLGLGTLHRLDGELVVVDGEAFQVTAAGEVVAVDDDATTPFAVVCRFEPGTSREVRGPLDLPSLTARLDELAPATEPVVAVRVDGTFAGVGLRSVAAQSPPYLPLTEVVAHQSTWEVPEVTGTVVGFRFPHEAQGLEVAGYHLHLLSEDRTVGGHVTHLTLVEGVAHLDAAHELHLELPPGVELPAAPTDGGALDPSALDEQVRAVEGG